MEIIISYLIQARWTKPISILWCFGFGNRLFLYLSWINIIVVIHHHYYAPLSPVTVAITFFFILLHKFTINTVIIAFNHRLWWWQRFPTASPSAAPRWSSSVSSPLPWSSPSCPLCHELVLSVSVMNLSSLYLPLLPWNISRSYPFCHELVLSVLAFAHHNLSLMNLTGFGTKCEGQGRLHITWNWRGIIFSKWKSSNLLKMKEL